MADETVRVAGIFWDVVEIYLAAVTKMRKKFLTQLLIPLRNWATLCWDATSPCQRFVLPSTTCVAEVSVCSFCFSGLAPRSLRAPSVSVWAFHRTADRIQASVKSFFSFKSALNEKVIKEWILMNLILLKILFGIMSYFMMSSFLQRSWSSFLYWTVRQLRMPNCWESFSWSPDCCWPWETPHFPSRLSLPSATCSVCCCRASPTHMIYCGNNTCSDVPVHRAKLVLLTGVIMVQKARKETKTLISFLHLTGLASSSPLLFPHLLCARSLSSWKLIMRRRLMEVTINLMQWHYWLSGKILVNTKECILNHICLVI